MELKEYLSPLLKWWWLIVAAVIITGVTSVVTAGQQKPMYQARTTLIIGRAIDNPNPTGNEFWLSQQLAETYADIAKREPVQEATKEALGINWLPAYQVTVLPETQLIEISVNDTSPERAQLVANELATQLMLQSPTSLDVEEVERRAFVNAQLDTLEAQILETQTEIAAQQARLGELFSAREIADTRAEIANLQSKLTTLQTNYSTLLATSERGAINTLTIIERAKVPQAPIGPNSYNLVVIAVAMSFVLAVGAVYGLEYLDDSIKSPEDIDRISDVPTLAGIARIPGEDGQSRLITMRYPRSPISEAFRVLRTGVQFLSVGKPNRSLLVTSANPSEGKSVTASNLAVVMAQAGHNVLLIDADLRRPEVHNQFGLSNERGATNLLLELSRQRQDEAMVWELLPHFVQSTPVSGLNVLTSGPIPPNPSELLGSEEMKLVLRALSEKFDFVVIDSPPAMAVTDAAVLGMQVDSVLLVLRAGRTRRGHLKRLVESLRKVNVQPAGIVLNELKPGSTGYQYYYYQNAYYLDRYYGSDRQKDVLQPKPKPSWWRRVTAMWRRRRRRDELRHGPEVILESGNRPVTNQPVGQGMMRNGHLAPNGTLLNGSTSLTEPDEPRELQQARIAARAGKKKQAQYLLATLLKENPQCAPAWYMLSQLMPDEKRQITFLRKTLAIEPTHRAAQHRLAVLQDRHISQPALRIPTAPTRPEGNRPVVNRSVQNERQLNGMRQGENRPVAKPTATASAKSTKRPLPVRLLISLIIAALVVLMALSYYTVNLVLAAL